MRGLFKLPLQHSRTLQHISHGASSATVPVTAHRPTIRAYQKIGCCCADLFCRCSHVSFTISSSTLSLTSSLSQARLFSIEPRELPSEDCLSPWLPLASQHSQHSASMLFPCKPGYLFIEPPALFRGLLFILATSCLRYTIAIQSVQYQHILSEVYFWP